MIRIIKNSLSSISWLRKLTRRILKVTPLNTAAAVVVTMAAQVFIVLAFLLPLKVVLLVAGEGIPRFLQGFVNEENRDAAIIAFATLAVACYGGYHLCQRIARKYIAQGTVRLVGEAQKLSVFDQQGQLAETGYTRFVEGVASIALFLVWLGLGLWLNTKIFTALLLISFIEYLLLAFAMDRPFNVTRALRRIAENGATRTARVFASINFLVVFLLLIVQFLGAGDVSGGGQTHREWASSPIVAILSIILMRQILQRAVSVIGVMEYMARNRLRLMPLFFPSTKYLPNTHKTDAFLDTLLPEVRDRWLTDFLVDVTDKEIGITAVRCRDSLTNGVIYLEISEYHGRWFGKYFSQVNALKANHEIELLARHPRDVPLALEYIGKSTIAGHHLLMFEGMEMTAMPKEDWPARALDLLFEAWTFVPDSDLVEAYLRTHSLLPERLDQKRFALLRIAVQDETEDRALAVFQDAWTEIRQRVQRLPLVVHNPQMTVADSWVVNRQGEPVCLHWSSWRLEAIGCDPHILKFDQWALDKALVNLGHNRALDSTVTVGDLQLAARLSLLERALQRNNLRQGMDTVVALVDGWSLAADAERITPAVAQD